MGQAVPPQSVTPSNKNIQQQTLPQESKLPMPPGWQFFEAGINFRNAGRASDAAASFQKALDAENGNPLYLCALGLALLDSGKTAEALAALENASKISPDKPDAYAALGTYFSRMNNPALAADNYRKSIALAPENHPDLPAIRNNLGEQLFFSGDISGAQAEFEKSASADGAYAPAWLNLGVVSIEQGLFATASAQLEKAVAISPDNPAARNNLAFAYFKLGRHDEAVREMDRAARADPANESYKKSLALLKDEKKKADAQKAEEKKAAALRAESQPPEIPQSELVAAIPQIQNQSTQIQETTAAAHDATAPASPAQPAAPVVHKPASPEQIEAFRYFSSAKHSYAKGNFSEAERIFRRAMALAPETPEFKAFAAMLLDKMGQVGAAETMLTQYIENSADPVPAALNALGAIYFRRGETDRALEVFSQGLALSPANSCAAAFSGTIGAQFINCSSASLLLARAASGGCRKAAVLNNLAFCSLRDADYKTALRLLSEAGAADTGNMTVAANIESVREAAGPNISAYALKPHAAAAPAPEFRDIPLETMLDIPYIDFGETAAATTGRPLRILVLSPATRNQPGRRDANASGNKQSTALAQAIASTGEFEVLTETSAPPPETRFNTAELTRFLSNAAARRNADIAIAMFPGELSLSDKIISSTPGIKTTERANATLDVHMVAYVKKSGAFLIEENLTGVAYGAESKSTLEETSFADFARRAAALLAARLKFVN